MTEPGDIGLAWGGATDILERLGRVLDGVTDIQVAAFVAGLDAKAGRSK